MEKIKEYLERVQKSIESNIKYASITICTDESGEVKKRGNHLFYFNNLKDLESKMNEHFPLEPKEETRYWEYVGETDPCFKKGKIYKLIEGRTIEHSYAFIDDEGDENGYDYSLKYFKPSTKEAFDKQNEGKPYKV